MSRARRGLALAACWLLVAQASHRVPLQLAQRRAGHDAAALEQFVPGAGLDKWRRGENRSSRLEALPAPPASLALPADALLELGSWSEVRKSLQDDFDLVYTVSAEVGEPPRSVRLIVDTGSSDLWMEELSYLSGASPAVLPYGQGQVSGPVVRDRFCILPVCVSGQAFVAATSIEGIPNPNLFEGLLGLGYPALARAQGTSFLQELAGSGQFHHLAFGLSLRRVSDSQQSFVTFGDLSDVMAEAPNAGGVSLRVLEYAGKLEYWLVRGSVAPQRGRAAEMSAVLDSGTSFIFAPEDAHAWLMAQLLTQPASETCGAGVVAGEVLCPCAVPLNPVTMSFDGEGGRQIHIELTARDLLQFKAMYLSPWGPIPVCRLTVGVTPKSLPFWILGDVFLRHVYAVHDFKGARVVLFPQPSEGQGVEVPRPLAEILRIPSAMTAYAAAFAVACSMAVAAAMLVALRKRRAGAPAQGLDGYSVM